MDADGHRANHYGAGYDYIDGSPHLKHGQLFRALTSRIDDHITRAAKAPHAKVLEIGAGDGSMTVHLLKQGHAVTATDLSGASVESMRARFADTDRFRAFHDHEGDLAVLPSDERYDVVLFASVLHHIPDYLGAISSAFPFLTPNGSLVAIQDPLWYPRLSRANIALGEFSYLTWRVTRGDLTNGIRTRLRRRFKGLSEEARGDVIEYHVVRDGVDEEAVAALLATEFDSVETLKYWSTQGTLQQRLGERLGLFNTFAIFADRAGRCESESEP